MTQAGDTAAAPTRGYTRLKVGLALLGLVLLVFLAWQSRHELAQVAGNVRTGLLVAAIAAGVALNALQGVYFALLMRKNGSAASTADCVSAFLVGQPGKYVPGKVWAPLIQQAALGRPGQLASIGTANVELALVVLVQMTCLGIACLALPHPAVLLAALAAGVAAGAVALRLQWAAPLVRRIPFLNRRAGVMAQARAGHGASRMQALCTSAAVMAVTLLASWLVLASMGWPVDLQAQARMLGSVFLGFASSLLAFPVPVGLGVREAATAGFGAIAAPDVPAAMLVSVAIFARGWQLAVDVASLALGLALSRGGAAR